MVEQVYRPRRPRQSPLWQCLSRHFGALLTETILFPVPHCHFTFGIPKMLRPYFRFDRDLLKDLCHLAHE